MSLMKLLITLKQQGHNKMTSPSRNAQDYTSMRKMSAALLQRCVSLHAGSEVRGYISQTRAPLLPASRADG